MLRSYRKKGESLVILTVKEKTNQNSGGLFCKEILQYETKEPLQLKKKKIKNKTDIKNSFIYARNEYNLPRHCKLCICSYFVGS